MKKRQIFLYLIFFIILFTLFSGCPLSGGGSKPIEVSRSFYMGFTPWPYRMDMDFAEVAYTYDLIQEHGDLVAHHFQQGVPWPESYEQKDNPDITSLNSAVTDEFNLRSGQTDSVKRIYLAVDCLNSARTGMTGYFGPDYNSHGTKEQQPLPDNSTASPDIAGYPDSIDWGSLDFSSQEIADAFISYSIALIDAFTDSGFNVEYYNYASEISDLKLHDAAAYSQFLIFAQRVYSGIKGEYPDLKLMVSAALKHPDSADMATLAAAFTSETNGSSQGPLTSCFDVLGISVYPYAFFNPAVSDDSSKGDNSLVDLPEN